MNNLMIVFIGLGIVGLLSVAIVFFSDKKEKQQPAK